MYHAAVQSCCKAQVSPELCEPAAALREVPLLPFGAGALEILHTDLLCAWPVRSLVPKCSSSLYLRNRHSCARGSVGMLSAAGADQCSQAPVLCSIHAENSAPGDP